jgi:hypothetical protein
MTPRVADLEVWQVGDEVHATFSLPIRPGASEVDYATLGVELWRRPTDRPARSPGARAPQADVASPGHGGLRPGSLGAAPGETEGPSVAEFTSDATLAASLSGETLFDFFASPRPEIVDRLPADVATPYLEYALVLKTNARKRGTVSNVVTFEPTQPPPVPADVVAEVAEGSIRLRWTAPEPKDREAPPAAEDEPAPEPTPEPLPEGKRPPGTLPPKPEAPAPRGFAFNVYRAIGAGAFGGKPLNEKPQSATSYTDEDVVEGMTYRYVVRSVRGEGKRPIESASSPEQVETYRDAFPPAVPEGLRLIAEGPRRVSLLWNPNAEGDLAGYGIYRREGEGEWVRLDAGAAKTATHVDDTAEPGRSYLYAVTAYDAAEPPNESAKCEPRSVDTPADAP